MYISVLLKSRHDVFIARICIEAGWSGKCGFHPEIVNTTEKRRVSLASNSVYVQFLYLKVLKTQDFSHCALGRTSYFLRQLDVQ